MNASDSISTPCQNPIDLLRRLSGDEVHRQLVTLDAERRYLLILLRAIRARERAAARGHRDE